MEYYPLHDVQSLDQQTANQSTGNTSLQFQKGSSSSVLYTSQNWDLEDELYEEDSFMKMCKSVEREELQMSKGIHFLKYSL